jgi:hypothetical protein
MVLESPTDDGIEELSDEPTAWVLPTLAREEAAEGRRGMGRVKER